MNSSFCKLSLPALAGLALTAAAYGGEGYGCVPRAAATTPAAPVNGVVFKVVQPTPKFNVRRPELISGARVTLFANFLRSEPGVVLFNLNGTSTRCNLVEWKPECVTIDLPLLGLLEPKDAEIQIVLPDGRIAKTFKVVYISQPDIVVHEESVPQPMPPAPAGKPAVYAVSTGGSTIFQAGE